MVICHLHIPLKVIQCFATAFHLHFEGQRVGHACCLHHTGFLLVSLFNPGDVGIVFLQNIS
jgi:hypothetical protein